MANIHGIEVSGEVYDLEDTNARNTATSADEIALQAKNLATSANTNANTAQETASTASTKADTAQSTADTAQSTADTAQSTADTAQSTADTALSKANQNETNITNLQATVAAIKGALFPVNSVYITYVNTNPSTLLGFGTWTLLSGGYLRNNASSASGGSLTSGSTTLTINQIPSHNHGGSTGNGLNVVTAAKQVTEGLNLATVPFFGATDQGLLHSHSISSQGGGQGHTHSIEPTYIRIYAWRRTA